MTTVDVPPPRYKVIIFAMLKGGSCKTTSAWFCALAYAYAGYKVMLLDADTVSQSAYDWHRMAQGRGEVPADSGLTVERHPFEDIDARIREGMETHDVVIVDVGGAAHQLLTQAVRMASIVLCPLNPSEADMRRVDATINAIELGAPLNPNPFEILFVLARVGRRELDRKKTRRELEVDHDPPLPVAETEIERLVDYTRSYGHYPSAEFVADSDYVDLLAEIDRLETETATDIHAESE